MAIAQALVDAVNLPENLLPPSVFKGDSPSAVSVAVPTERVLRHLQVKAIRDGSN